MTDPDHSKASGPGEGTRPDVPAQPQGGATQPFRFEGAEIRFGTAAAKPATPAADEAVGPGPVPGAGPPSAALPAADPDAAIAAQMARVQQHLNRIGKAPAAIAIGEAALSAGARTPSARRQAFVVAAIAVASALIVLLAYLATAVPGPWFPDEPPRPIAADRLEIARGKGARSGPELVVDAPGEGGVTVVSASTSNLRADRFRGVAWIVSGLSEQANVRIVWRSDSDPGRIQSLPAVIDAGRVRLVEVAGKPGWRGNITGLGFVVTGPLQEPLRFRGVVAKPMGAIEILRDRVGEWLAPERWTGTSINVVVGGADNQDLPLSLLVAAIVGLSAAFVLALRRWRPRSLPHATTAVAALFLLGWFALDLRWSINLTRQLGETIAAFAGKSERDKRLAAVDGPLYEFVERARAAMPAAPQRVWVVSDAPYFSGRAAYQLYPHNVHFQSTDRAMPDPTWVKPGDWMLVFQRRGVLFDGARNLLRWDAGPEIPAELKATGPGAALFVLK